MFQGFRGVISVEVRIRFYPPVFITGKNRSLGIVIFEINVGMKQKVRVVGMIRKADHFLVLKKNMGRIEGIPTWGLAASKIRFGEQPEEAMARLVDEELSLSVRKVKYYEIGRASCRERV